MSTLQVCSQSLHTNNIQIIYTIQPQPPYIIIILKPFVLTVQNYKDLYLSQLIKMEWKKCKSSKTTKKHYKKGCTKTVNSIEPNKEWANPSHDRIMTRDDQQITHEFTTHKQTHHPFCDLFKQNQKYQQSNTKCSTFSGSLHANHHNSKLSKELVKIGKQFEHQNIRIKQMLAKLQQNSIHNKHKSSPTMHSQKLTLTQKIKQQNILVRSMYSLKPYR